MSTITEPAARPAPIPVRVAVGIMYLSAALLVLGVLAAGVLGTFALATETDGVTDTGSDAGTVRAVGGVLLVLVAVVGLFFAWLHAFLGRKMQRRRNWARITTIVLSAFGVVASVTLAVLAEPVLDWLPGGILSAGMIVLLSIPVSRDWFRTPAAPAASAAAPTAPAPPRAV